VMEPTLPRPRASVHLFGQVLSPSQHGRVHRLGPGSVRPYGISRGRARMLGREASSLR
jgi:hypothetical protein